MECLQGCGRHLLLINVSPCEFGHVLLVPEIDGELPQVRTEDAINPPYLLSHLKVKISESKHTFKLVAASAVINSLLVLSK